MYLKVRTVFFELLCILIGGMTLSLVSCKAPINFSRGQKKTSKLSCSVRRTGCTVPKMRLKRINKEGKEK